MTKTVDFGRRGDAFNRWIYSLAQARPTEFGSSRFTFTDVDGVWRQYGSRPEWLALIETKTRAKDALSLVILRAGSGSAAARATLRGWRRVR